MSENIACTHMGPWPNGFACRVCYGEARAQITDLLPENDALRFENRNLRADATEWRRIAHVETKGNACAWKDKYDEARAEVERLQRRYTSLIGVVQRWQPAGSPPPGDAEMLAGWICRSLEERAEQAEAWLAKIRGWLVDFWLSENDVTSDVAGDFLRKEAHAAAAKEKP